MSFHSLPIIFKHPNKLILNCRFIYIKCNYYEILKAASDIFVSNNFKRRLWGKNCEIGWNSQMRFINMLGKINMFLIFIVKIIFKYLYFLFKYSQKEELREEKTEKIVQRKKSVQMKSEQITIVQVILWGSLRQIDMQLYFMCNFSTVKLCLEVPCYIIYF